MSEDGRDQTQQEQEAVALPEGYQEFVTLLSIAVPLRIALLLEQGGATAEDFQRVAGYDDEIGRADALFFASERRGKRGEAASWFNKVAEALAVLSFCSGGVDLFGLRYESLPLLTEWQKRHGQVPPQTEPVPGRTGVEAAREEEGPTPASESEAEKNA